VPEGTPAWVSAGGPAPLADGTYRLFYDGLSLAVHSGDRDCDDRHRAKVRS
jgi:hypothetical protein